MPMKNDKDVKAKRLDKGIKDKKELVVSIERGIPLKTSETLRKYHHYHHQGVLIGRISLNLSRHPSLSSIAPSRSFKLHPHRADVNKF